MTEYKIFHDDDYTALYEDGLMMCDGDLHYIHKYLEAKLGVTNIYDADFVNPETDRGYDTLEELEESCSAETARIVKSPNIALAPDVYLAGPATTWRQKVGADLVKAGLQVAYPVPQGISSASSAKWEQDHIARSKVVLFWFSGNEDPSATMYELGRLASTDKPLIAGCPPPHDSRDIIANSLQNTRPGSPVYPTLIEARRATVEMCADLA